MIDIEKFICSLLNRASGLSVIKVIDILDALNNQGLDYKDGKIAKIEPKKEFKFKKGDWVMYNGFTYQITEVYEDGYSNDKQGFIPLKYQDEMRLWDIFKDAKDGDVLACGNDIVIFKENTYSPKDKLGCMFVYCSCNNFYEFGGINPTTYKPATKEQREFLFQKMKEAGYEWDAENKQLKKVEKKEELIEFETEFLKIYHHSKPSDFTDERLAKYRKDIVEVFELAKKYIIKEDRKC